VTKAKQLTMGADSSSLTPDEEKERIAVLRATVETYLPDFVKGIETLQAKDTKDSAMVLHQDSFAAGYHDDEYTLLGMAVKYAGLNGVEVKVMGTNHETF
jgi:hypothetical protein